MTKKNFKIWLRAALIRAVKTVAETAVAAIGTSAMLNEVNWISVFSTAALAGIISMLWSVRDFPKSKRKRYED